MIYLQDPDFTLYNGDALEVLQGLPDESVHMCVTSPPFYGLRDYGTGTWEGGDEGCDHRKGGEPQLHVGSDGKVGRNNTNWDNRHGAFGAECGKCGAHRVDRQIGLESSPDEWVAALVDVFREVRRVLRSDGTLWLEIGDSYASSPAGNSDATMTAKQRSNLGSLARWGGRSPEFGVKPKDLIGAPWLLAFALRADGWYLRSDIIWARPNPMPESVRDRPTKSHSYVFLLSKSPRYFFDQEAVREPLLPQTLERGYTASKFENGRGQKAEANVDRNDAGEPRTIPAGRNIRSVWTIPTEPLPDEHYAAFPSRLVERCILAGTSERGCCPECGAPWERVVEREFVKTRGNSHPGKVDATGYARCAENENPLGYGRYDVETTGWRPSCSCGMEAIESSDADGNIVWRDYSPPFDPAPCIVLDPFLGSGTTALVARKHGRRTIGIELSPDYCAMAARRLSQLSLLA